MRITAYSTHHARRTALATAILLLVSGCGGDRQEQAAKGKTQQAVSVMADFSVGDSLVQAHLKANKLEQEGVRYERSVRSLVENNALAYIIATRSDGISPELAYKVTTTRNNVLIKAYLDEHVEQAISEKVTEKYYNDNIERYTTRRVKGAQILLNLNGLSPEQRAEKIRLATELSERARGGVEFEQLVKEHSDDPKSAGKGGEMEWLSSKDSAANPLFTTLLSLNKGDIADPVESEHGLHILKLLEEPEVETLPLEQVKDKIAYQLKYDERIAELKRLKQTASLKLEQDLSTLGIGMEMMAGGN